MAARLVQIAMNALREIMAQKRLEIVVLTSRRNELAEPVLRLIGLGGI